MLTIQIPISEDFDEEKEEFLTNYYPVDMEHSLVSLSKWESFFQKPFLSSDSKTAEETLWYIRAMVLTPNVPDEVLEQMTEKNVEEINAYINGKQTATWFRENSQHSMSREVITAEIIYYWMIALKIPLDWENRHLNRLFTLVQVNNQKNQPAKKMGRRDAAQERQRLNAQRKSQLATKG